MWEHLMFPRRLIGDSVGCMRVEPYTEGSFVHVVKRGARGLPIVRDNTDCWRFARLLYHMNDEYKDDFWERSTADFDLFERPESWPERRPLVKILAWVLMPNHIHLFLKETRKGGVTKFTRKVFDSMTKHFNTKYDERGSIFQGSYRGRTISKDQYFKHLAAYIMVKNVFELYPDGGYKEAVSNFNDAWRWGVEGYAFSSLPDYAGRRNSPILDKDLLGDIFSSPKEFRRYAREAVFSKTRELEEKMGTSDVPKGGRSSRRRST